MNSESIEKWKNIEGYNGRYQVSSLGRVKSIYKKKFIIMSIFIDGTRKYWKARLSKNDGGKDFFVHRLVAQAFIPNPENYQIIHHKDNNGFNNNLENLQWTNHAQNMQYSWDERVADVKSFNKIKNLSIPNIYKNKNNLEDERWIEMQNYNGRFLISDYGRIKSLYKNKERIIQPFRSRDRLMFFVQSNKIGKHYYPWRLVAQHFIDNPNNLPQVNHKDGNPDNNHFSNLEWVTQEENTEHAIKNGLVDNKGEKNCFSKITEKDVLEIRKIKLENPEITYLILGEKFGITRCMASLIVRGKSWKHI